MGSLVDEFCRVADAAAPEVYHLSDAVYRALAEELYSNFPDRNYWEGAVEVLDGDVWIDLTVSCFIYYAEDELPEGRSVAYVDKVRVGSAECTATIGEDVLATDFDVKRLEAAFALI